MRTAGKTRRARAALMARQDGEAMTKGPNLKAKYTAQRKAAHATGDFKTQSAIYKKLAGKPTGNEKQDANQGLYARRQMRKGMGGHRGT